MESPTRSHLRRPSWYMGVTLTGTLHRVGSYGTSPSLEKTQPTHHSNRASTLPKFHHKPGACSGCQDPGVSADRGLPQR